MSKSLLLAALAATALPGGLPAVDVSDKLHGTEIAAVRIAASRSTLPTARRVRMWHRKQRKPAHVGKKQLAKIAARKAKEASK